MIPVVLALSVVLVGCGGEDEQPEAKSSPSTSDATPSPSETTPTPSATPEPDKDGDGDPDSEDFYPNNPLASTQETMTIECTSDGVEVVGTFTVDRVKPDWKAVWSSGMKAPENEAGQSYSCEATPDGSSSVGVSRAEEAVLANSAAEDAALADEEDYGLGDDYYADEDVISAITIAYEQCAEFGNGWMKNKWPLGAGQAPEAERAMTLCPRHPQAAAIRKRIVGAAEETKMRGDGRVFDDGTYRVGKQIKPGTYAVEDTGACYWERLDANGEIIDNNFVQDAFRVQATIKSSDYSFRSDGCGTWKPVG